MAACVMRWTIGSMLVLGFVAAGATARAQGRGRVEGVAVEPSTGLAIPNVEVRLLGTDRLVRTDSLGSFRLSLDPGHYLMRASRLGFGSRSLPLEVGAGDTLTVSIELDVLPVQLSEVVVRAREERYRGKMAGFAERMRTSAASRSSFITRDEIERRAPSQISDMMRERGGRVTLCSSKATIYVDGVMVPQDKIGDPPRGRRTEPTQRDLRLDHFPPREIEAIEVYPGGATTPAEFSATASKQLEPGCTILIWTR
ncbi:MAG TPA: carboxypeptidase regulatory-like domain-containing protein [Gemmatimonadaceae bacterium]|nr:carboxypeptidase regulatory-like domain-containing protein [Gemmatimonadaceae bacterium]